MKPFTCCFIAKKQYSTFIIYFIDISDTIIVFYIDMFNYYKITSFLNFLFTDNLESKTENWTMGYFVLGTYIDKRVNLFIVAVSIKFHVTMSYH